MIDNSRYQWVVGAVAVVMVIAFSVVLYTSNKHHSSPGIAAGKTLPKFVAPLAIGGPNDSANTSPVCNPAKPAAGGINVCGRTAIVLDLFSTAGSSCVKSVSALQTVAHAWKRGIDPGSGAPHEHAPLHPVGAKDRVTFAAVAAGGTKSQTSALARKHDWTIPVGIDPSGAVGALYGVTICPMIEIADASGTVERLLIGDRYDRPAAIAAAVHSALGRR
jgi:hypothetical protein